MAQEKRAVATGKAIDLSHHLSASSRARKVSPLKGLQKYHGRPGQISLAGGLPDPAYFPFASISGDALIPDSFPRIERPESTLLSWFWNMFGSSTEKTERITVPKFAAQPNDVDLATALQYSPVGGMLPLQEFIHNFSGKVYKPVYSDWSTLIHAGNTDGMHRAFITLCNPGERILVEQWTYPSALAATRALGVLPASVKVDGQGMSDTDLEHVLSTWDETARGAKRPHVMYTIPTGQNPTGATMGVERKKAIYDICVKYDIIIIEDDPYYFLQEGMYYPKELRNTQKQKSLKNGEDEETRYLNSLSPSFIRFDYEGRVVRLDTFSKTIAPGSRLGWFTCNPLFAERFEREGETSTLTPCGFAQSLITQLVSKHWGFSNYIRWLQGLQAQYTWRRDYLVDCIFDSFEVQPTGDPALQAVFGAGLPVMTAYAKIEGREMQEKTRMSKMPLFSFVPPTAGMFVWLKFHLQDHVPKDPNAPEGQTFDERVWTDLAENGLLIAPGAFFTTEDSAGGWSSGVHESAFRIAFSMGTQETMKKGIDILAKVLKTYVKP